MRFCEAMKAIEEGKKVRCCRWDACSYVDRRGPLIFDIDDLDEEWELYEKPALTFSQAVEGLKKGKKFRRGSWFNKAYFIIVGEKDEYGDSPVYSPNNSVPKLCIEDFEATDWVEVK